MDVEIFPKNGLVPLVLCVKFAIINVHDLTLSTNFKLQISSIFLEKIVLNSLLRDVGQVHLVFH
jgi:hypothetical protein